MFTRLCVYSFIREVVKLHREYQAVVSGPPAENVEYIIRKGVESFSVYYAVCSKQKMFKLEGCEELLRDITLNIDHQEFFSKKH